MEVASSIFLSGKMIIECNALSYVCGQNSGNDEGKEQLSEFLLMKNILNLIQSTDILVFYCKK